MNWFEAIPLALVTIAWLLVPGLAISYLVGLRGIAAWALAPITSIALIASTAVLAGMAGIDWSVPVVLAVCAAAILVVAAVTIPLRRRAIFAPTADPRRVSLAAFVGLVPAFVLGAITIVAAISAPDTLNQTYDGLFHYNALAYINDSHNASALTLATLGNPEVTPLFYPAAWHDLASLVMMSTGTSIEVVANLVPAVSAVVLWPLSCLLLVRQLFGRNVAALAITGALSIAFTAFPWDLLGFGVLWPNLLGMALAPAGLAIVFTLTGWVHDDAIGRNRAWLALPIVLLATGFTHPNVLFSVAVLSFFPIAARFGVRWWRLHGEGRTVRGLGELAAFVVFLGVAWYWAATTPAFAATRSHHWPPFETPANAVGEVVLNATNRQDALWILSVVVIVGIIASGRFTTLRLIVAGHLATTFLYVLTASINRPDTEKFTGYWYNDSHRLAAMLPITAVPLAIGGILFIAAKILAKTETAESGWRKRVGTTPVTTLVLGLTLVLVVVTGGLYPADRENRVAAGYEVPVPGRLVTQDLRDFLDRIDDEIPEDALVAGNPFNGSAMLWALTDREVLFPHFRSEQSPEQDLVANKLDEAATDPEVCDAVRELGVDYLLVGGVRFRTTDPRWDYYSGLDDPGARPGFELIDHEGNNKLFRITACG